VLFVAAVEGEGRAAREKDGEVVSSSDETLARFWRRPAWAGDRRSERKARKVRATRLRIVGDEETESVFLDVEERERRKRAGGDGEGSKEEWREEITRPSPGETTGQE
jgi:hypothetical protein